MYIGAPLVSHVSEVVALAKLRILPREFQSEIDFVTFRNGSWTFPVWNRRVESGIELVIYKRGSGDL